MRLHHRAREIEVVSKQPRRVAERDIATAPPDPPT